MVRLSVHSSLFLPFTRRSASVIVPKNPARWTMQSQPSSHFTTNSSQSRSSNDDLLAIARDQPDPFLHVGLQRESMPRHVALILDGNRRWAEAHGKELDYGPFCQGQLNLTDLCIKWGVAAISCLIFSTENWKRSRERRKSDGYWRKPKASKAFTRGNKTGGRRNKEQFDARVEPCNLMIQTGGDQRVSNFLVWQLSHAEFYFTNVYGPDFGEPHFIDALRWFQQCDRRFGK
ncbi:hypothetical protein Cgig2_032767 [Carnegiea gigantea]|uniref:Alkyl transferase n=1 Tax=Carnegiea gigantea TaxID=171969 RepID=A0A9Q1KJF8_9CARY|nr:hypothetical protein Cgig2_032767 [Carnegiea gigantea]